MSELKIGNVVLKNNCIIAPMAGVTDLPFRILCKEQGAGLLCTEMVSAKAILYGNQNTEALMEIHPEEMPVSLQLFGSDPQIISQIASQIEEKPFSILDINMGCPVAKIVNNQEGSALMKNPLLVGEIISQTVRAINKPVTVKIRKGFDENHCNAVEIAKIAEASGAAAIIVHGRTREQFYSGKADWNIIRQVKESVQIPVIGNGDVVSPETAKELLEQTGCDGIMIGRAIRGNPWLIHQIIEYLETGNIPCKPTKEQIKETILRHGRLQLACKGEYVGIREMRKHLSWYTAGLPNSAKLRGHINQMETFQTFMESVERIFTERRR